MSEGKQNGYSQYKSNQVQTSDSGKLIIMLYEAAINSLDTAERNMNYKSYDLVSKSIGKVVDIITELKLSLDLQVGEIATRLDSLYAYLLKTLKEANVNKDNKKLSEVKKILNDLLSSWKVAYREYVSDNKGDDGIKKSSGGLSIVG